MVDGDDKPSTGLAKFQHRYSEIVLLRATIQAIPHIGSPLDTLLAGRATQIQLDRVEKFAKQLAERLNAVKCSVADFDNEGFSDLILNTLERVSRSRSEQKRSRFAQIIANQVTKPTRWEEPDNAVRLLSDLEDIHIEVIEVALAAPVLKKSFQGLRVISLDPPRISDPERQGPLALTIALPHYERAALRMACAELTAKALLHDEGIGRWDLKAMQYFVPTDLTEWFSAWITRGDRA